MSRLVDVQRLVPPAAQTALGVGQLRDRELLLRGFQGYCSKDTVKGPQFE